MSNDIGGVWRTVGGRRIFIKDGEDLETAMKKSGKFGNKKEKDNKSINKEEKKEFNKIEDFETLKKYENMSDEDYKKSYDPNTPDYILQNMAKENGFDGLPKKINEKEYNNLIKDGAIRIQRVVSDDNEHSSEFYVNQFKNGEYYVSNAKMYGSGIYASGNEKDIETYSKKGLNSKTIEMAIDKSAKVKTFENQMDMYKFTAEQLDKIDGKYQRVMEEPGKILISQGYDIAYIKDVNYYVIYNRTKINVKE